MSPLQKSHRSRTARTLPGKVNLLQKTKLDNESGVILVTVIILAIVLSVVSLGIMSINISQVKTSSAVIQTITAEQLATGVFYQQYQQKLDQTGTTPGSMVINGKTYTISRSETSGSGPNSTNQIQLTITY